MPSEVRIAVRSLDQPGPAPLITTRIAYWVFALVMAFVSLGRGSIDVIFTGSRGSQMMDAQQRKLITCCVMVDTDHRPVLATIALKLKRSQKREAPPPRYNIHKLQDPELQQRFSVEVSNRFLVLSEEA